LDSLLDEDVRVTVDLFGLGEGTYSLEPDADVFVNDIEVRSIQPPELTLTLSPTLTTTEGITATGGTQPLSQLPTSGQTTTSQTGSPRAIALPSSLAIALPAGLILRKRKDLS
jgi:hypothetical protein